MILTFTIYASGVDIQLVDPGQVKTAMTELFEEQGSWAIPTPSIFVQSAITTLGFSPRTCGYWAHSLKVWLFVQWLLPNWMLENMTLKTGRKQYDHAIKMKKGY